MRCGISQWSGLLLLLATWEAQAADAHYQNVTVEPRTDVNFSFYDVKATDGKALRDHLLQVAPKTTAGHRAIGKAVYQVDWQLDLNQQSDTCQLFGVHVLTKVNVVMPNWLQLSKLNESTQNNWNGFLSAMMEYEGRHKEIVQEAAQKIGDGIAGLPVNGSCQALREQADAVGETQLEKAREQVRRYQSETGKGRYMGVAYPKF